VTELTTTFVFGGAGLAYGVIVGFSGCEGLFVQAANSPHKSKYAGVLTRFRTLILSNIFTFNYTTR